jgi:hypothetical protein
LFDWDIGRSYPTFSGIFALNLNLPRTRFASWSALGSGILGLLAILALTIFYVFQVPGMLAQDGPAAAPFNFGTLNDVLTLAAAIFLLLLVVQFPASAGEPGARFPRTARWLGMLGALGIIAAMSAFVLGRISLVQQAIYYAVSFGPLGAWHLAVNSTRWRPRLIPAGLARLGQVVGLGELAAFAAFLLFGGPRLLGATDLSQFLTNIPLLAGMLISGLTGYVGGPIWVIGLGRQLLSQADNKPEIRR